MKLNAPMVMASNIRVAMSEEKNKLDNSQNSELAGGNDGEEIGSSQTGNFNAIR